MGQNISYVSYSYFYSQVKIIFHPDNQLKFEQLYRNKKVIILKHLFYTIPYPRFGLQVVLEFLTVNLQDENVQIKLKHQRLFSRHEENQGTLSQSRRSKVSIQLRCDCYKVEGAILGQIVSLLQDDIELNQDFQFCNNILVNHKNENPILFNIVRARLYVSF